MDDLGKTSSYQKLEKELSDFRKPSVKIGSNIETDFVVSLIFDMTEDVLYTIRLESDGDYVFQSMNTKGLIAIGLEREQLVGKKVREIIPEPSLSLVLANYEKAISEKKIVQWIETTPYPTGVKTGKVQIAPCFDKDGNCSLLLGSVHDITDRLTLEQSMIEIAEKNKELEQFAYIASHDLQEPLRTVTSVVDLLTENYESKLGEEGNRYLKFIAQASSRMSQLINGLLEYSLIGNNNSVESVDCNKLLKSILEDLTTAINEANAILNVDELPQLQGNETELRLLFQNLIVNAIKFRKQGTVPTINISAQKKNKYWEIAVSDNGIGIAEEHQKRIFDLFQRLHIRSEYEGTGLGLAYCKKIVQLHGGSIKVDSVLGKGSSFYINWPNI